MIKRIILVIILFLLIVGIGLNKYMFSPMDPGNETNINFVIEPEESTDSILDNLQKDGLIRSTFFAKIYLKFGNRADFKAGNFILKKSFGLKEIIEVLNKPGIQDIKQVTFPEGIRVIDYANIANKELGINKDEFLINCNDEEFINKLKKHNELLRDYNYSNKELYLLEGLLAPNTYSVPSTINAQELIELLTQQSNKEYLEHKAEFDKSKLGLREIFTIASLVEAEAKTDADRKMLAAIFINRIDKGMSLGSDVTTYYGLQVAMGDRELTEEELNEVNDYNTRSTMVGLPAGPIDSPSWSALDATLNHAKTDDLYFVSDKNGKIYFTKTLEEHTRMINKLKSEGLWFNIN